MTTPEPPAQPAPAFSPEAVAEAEKAIRSAIGAGLGYDGAAAAALSCDGVRREVEALRAKIERQRADLRQRQDGAEADQRQVPFLSARLQEARAESARLATALEAAEYELTRLRVALLEVAAWDSRSAARHGNAGVREYARAVLDAEVVSPAQIEPNSTTSGDEIDGSSVNAGGPGG